jgi:hypothetical protein
MQLAFICPLSYLSLVLSLPLLVPSIPRSPYINMYTLYHALEHHHSPPEITSPLSLSYSPYTFHYLHYLSDMRLICGSFVECVTQVTRLLVLFSFFPISTYSFHYSCFSHWTPSLSSSQLSLPAFSSSRTFPLSFTCLSFFVTLTKSSANARLIHSPSFSSTFTLFLILAYISSIFRTGHSLIPLSLSHSPKNFLCVYLANRRPDVYKQCIQGDSRSPFVRNFLISQNRINVKIGSRLQSIALSSNKIFSK